jgi:hypothetical protein
VLLGANFFSDTSADQQSVLLHEMLHVDTHWSDTEIFQKFASYGLQHINPGTGDITAWISTGCTSTPPGAR